MFFLFKQKTAYEMRISDWSSDVCSSDLKAEEVAAASVPGAPPEAAADETAKNAPASNFSENNDLIEFTYAYPADAARIPELAKMLDEDRATKREALIAAAQRDKDAAEKAGFPYRKHSHLQTWARVTSTPRFKTGRASCRERVCQSE